MEKSIPVNKNLPEEDMIQERLNQQAMRKDRITRILPYMGILILIVFFSITTSGQFIGVENLRLLLNQCFTMVIVAVGAAFLYSIGAMDMAIGSVMALSALVTTLLYLKNVPLLLSLLVGVMVSVISMLVTAFAKVLLNISSFIASLCVMNICNGFVLASMKYNGRVSFPYSKAGYLDSIPVKLLVLVVVIGIGYILFNYTAFGKSLRAIGGKEKVAEISGIRVDLMIILAYITMGVVLGVASLFSVVRGGIADISIGSGMALNIMTAVVLGGFPLSGGANARFSAPIIGSLMVTVLSNGLSLMGYANALGYGVKGLLFIIVVALTYEKSKGKLIN